MIHASQYFSRYTWRSCHLNKNDRKHDSRASTIRITSHAPSERRYTLNTSTARCGGQRLHPLESHGHHLRRLPLHYLFFSFSALVLVCACNFSTFYRNESILVHASTLHSNKNIKTSITNDH